MVELNKTAKQGCVIQALNHCFLVGCVLHLFCTSEKSNVPLDHGLSYLIRVKSITYIKRYLPFDLQEMKINDESINAIHLENYCFKGFWLCVRFACKKDTFLIIFLDEFQFLKCWGTWTKPGFTMNSLQSLINVDMIHKLRESVGRVSINIQFLKCRG